MTMEYLVSARRMEVCDCGETSRVPGKHTDACALFACYACGARTMVKGVEHADDCADRCPHCRSEGKDNDHREGCPTIGTCAQCYPSIPREDWHLEPSGVEWTKWINEHLDEYHPTTKR